MPDMWEIIFPNIPVQGRIVHPNVHGFSDGSGQDVLFPSYYFEIVQCCLMATIILMQEYW